MTERSHQKFSLKHALLNMQVCCLCGTCTDLAFEKTKKMPTKTHNTQVKIQLNFPKAIYPNVSSTHTGILISIYNTYVHTHSMVSLLNTNTVQ